jgi:cobalamin 5'-phosphate synthase/cobalamin synthase
MKAVLVATAFLTRVPVPVVADGTDVAGAARWFPVIGGAIGGLAAVIAWAMRDVLAFPSALIATLLLGYSAWVTGAIHLDGLADTADGFGGGRTRDDVLRIMRDPLIGSYGATALLIVVATKAAALTALLDRGAAFPYLVTAPAIARWTISVLASWLPYARTEGGLGQSMTHQHVTGLLVSTTLTAAIALIALRANAPFAWMPALVMAAWMVRAARRRIGGVTGDVFGATVELTETVVLLSGVVLTGRA